MTELFADPACWEFKKKHPEDFESFGCGPGGIGDFLVPDTVYGLSVNPCCRIHDWYYRFYPGNTEADREMADRVFKNNMIRLVTAKTKIKWLRWLRLRRVSTMYTMVRFAGAPAFFGERNTSSEVEVA